MAGRSSRPEPTQGRVTEWQRWQSAKLFRAVRFRLRPRVLTLWTAGDGWQMGESMLTGYRY